MKILKNTKGESLIEILISLMLLSIIAVTFLRAVTSLVTVNLSNDSRMNATYMAERYMEYMTKAEGGTITALAAAITTEPSFTGVQLTDETPYKFKINENGHSSMYCIVTIDYKYFRDNGQLSRVTVTVYDGDDTQLCTLQSALYWI